MRYSAGQLRENLTIAFDTLRANKLRSALTILGVVIGVATVMTMATIVDGIQTQIVRSFQVAGPTTFYVLRIFGGGRGDPSNPPKWIRVRPELRTEDAEAIAALPEIEYAGIWVRAQGRIEYLGTRTQALAVWGADDGFSAIQGGGLEGGRWFTRAELRSGAAVAVLDVERARQVFGRVDPIGKTAQVAGRPLEVIGLYRPEDNIFQPQGQEVGAIVPYRFALSGYRVDRLTSQWIPVKPREGVTITAAQEAVTVLLRTQRGLRPADKNNFDLVTQDQVLETFNRITGAFYLVMIALASVALMVGGIGVMAIMMVSVTARTREIGVRKALGATQRDILTQFLTEAAALTLLGGAIGVVTGLLIGQGLTRLIDIEATTPIGYTAIAVFVSVVIGLVFGVVPARRAAKLDPIEALRYE
ncbi:MAG: FtsX-like permease family protein [Gemmatimonadetes bacterium]|nr:FtsX-like permease family protein [Gemmatimonadota bacterium]